MVKCIIVDDEQKSRQALATLLKRYCSDVHVVAQAGSVSEALGVLENEIIDLAFLDISMPDGTGFVLLEKTQAGNCAVVFITAYNEYALQAIKANALDYLLKPINIRELQQSVAKVRDKMGTAPQQNIQKLFDELHRKYNSEGKIAVPVNTGLKFLPVKTIIRLQAEGAYTRIFSENEAYVLSSRPLGHYEQLLPNRLFFRAHHSHIINLGYIKEYHRGEGGYVVMSDGVAIDISKRRKKSFLDLFQAKDEA